ncbi:GspH/FimT family pseudopilin [Trinickia sp.]|uniref:GspH/FimT family pseudopilin n=1 Tax=Trinickia sp. TaxID=2571163 RepID=UPI003F7FB786
MQGGSVCVRAGRRAPWRCGGFSLVELLIVTGLAASAAMAVAPAFSEWHARDRVDRAARALLASLTFARGEAVARGARVVVCPAIGAAGCAPTGYLCARGALDWSCGWAVVVASGRARAERRAYGDPSPPIHPVLRSYPRIADVAIGATAARVEFTPPAGQVIGGFRHFEFSSIGVPAGANVDRSRRCIRIAAGGRARLEHGGCDKPAKT